MNFYSAARSLVESWPRSILTATGIMVASVAIILLMSIGIGVQQDVTSQVESVGAGLIVVPGHVELGNFNPNIAGKSYLDDEAAALVKSVPGVKRLARLSFAGGSVKAGGKETYPLIVAADSAWFDIFRNTVREGKTYDSTNDDKPYCVLASVAADQLFAGQSAVGKLVMIDGHEYTVMGVLEDKKGEQSLFSMQSLANVTYIPLPYLKSVETGVQINRFMVETDPSIEPKSLVSQVDAKLASHLDHSHFSVLTQEDLLGLMFQLISILTTLVAGLTSIALFVGGVGVMTVMLMSVNERVKEIGVRKAVGARRKDIFLQFLYEALMISVGGVAVGLIVSGVVIVGLAHWTKIKPILTPETLVISLAVGVGLGALFGLIPAMKAAVKNPVDALRSE